MQAYSGVSCSMHLDIGVGIAKGDFHGHIGKGHYVGRQADYETITYIGRQRRLQVYPHVGALKAQSYETRP